MFYSYQFRLKIIKLVIEQDYGIREVAELHNIPRSAVIYWIKAFQERGLDGVKSPYTSLPPPPENSESKDEKERHWNPGNNRLFT
jgi:ISPsy8, transposase orfA